MTKSHSKQVRSREGRLAFLRSIKLVGLRLISADCRVDHSKFFELIEQEKGSLAISAKYRLKEVSDDAFDCEGEFHWTATNEKGDQGLTLNCVYEAHFHAEGASECQEFASDFVQSEMKLVFWPYFRQLASDLSSRMSIPPITVPMAAEVE